MGFQEDLVYLKILLASIAASFLIKRCHRRDLVAGLLGLLVVGYICQKQLLYSLIAVIVNLAICNYLPHDRTDLISFVFCFLYLTFFRCAYLFGLPPVLPYANAVQLIMTLRCVGLAFELRDAKQVDKKSNDNRQSSSVASSGVLEQFLYCYNFIGLFTGPYFSFRVHLDNVQCKYLLKINYASEIVPRLMLAPCFIACLEFTQWLFPLAVVHTDQFYIDNGFLFRFFYMVPIFFQLRVRCFVAWTLSECACIVAGIGAYPAVSMPRCGQGPTDLNVMKTFEGKSEDEIEGTEFSFETIRNIDPAGCEFAGTFRETMRYWNRSVQFWLATYIYRRSPKAYRTAVTMLVSAYWHGVHPGYYLSFMTVPLCLYVEDQMIECFGLDVSVDDDQQGNNQNAQKQRGATWESKLVTTFDKLWLFYRTRGFEYMSMGFLLLSWKSTVTYWFSIGFALHTSLALLLVVVLVKKKFRLSAKNQKNK